MAHTDHDGVIASDQVYTTKALARILGKDEEWIKSMIRKFEMDYVKLGATYFVSGVCFRLCIERVSKPPCHDEKDV